MHKVVRRHTVRKRSVNAEAGFDDAAALTEALAAGGRDQLSPLEALAILDQLEAAMAALPEDRRPILELRLAGHDLEAIAAAVGCSQRTVRRVLAEVKERLEREPPEDDP
jgi:RNA polymerase sigma factor (sigma-70 family)